MTTSRTRRGSEQPADRPTGPVPVSSSTCVYQDSNGFLVTNEGFPVPKEDLYEMQIVHVEELMLSFKGGPEKPSLRISFELIGTEQPFGNYAGKPFRASTLVGVPASGKVQPVVEGKPFNTNLNQFLTLLGYDINPQLKTKDIDFMGLIGAYARGYVFHKDPGGYATVKLGRTIEDEDGNKINRGFLPVKNEEHIKENMALRNGIFIIK